MNLTNKPIITRIRHIGILQENAIYGNLYHNALKPLIEVNYLSLIEAT